MASSSAGEALPSVYTTRPGEALPRWLCAELAQLDRASVYETEGHRFESYKVHQCRRGGMVTQWIANPCMQVRILSPTPIKMINNSMNK